MRKYFIFAAVLFAAAISCTKEVAPVEKPIESHEGYVAVTLSAQCDVETKAALNGKKIVWEVGEEVAVFTSASENPLKFTVVEASDTGSVKIAGEAPADATTFIAAYPYDYAESCKDNVVSMYMPSSQLVPEGGNLDPKALESVAFFESAESKAVFKNIFSLISFELDKEGIYEIQITPQGESGQIGAGNINVTVSADADPVIADASPVISIGTESGRFAPFATETTYYVAVTPGAIDGLKVRMFSGDKYLDRSTKATSKLARNQGFNFKVLTDGCEWKYFTIKNADDLQAFLAEAANYTAEDEVQLANDIDMSDVELENCPNYAGVFDGKGYSLKNWTSTAPLFGTVTGEVKNLTIDASCKISSVAPGNTGFIAKALKGKMTNCHNKADVSFTLSGDTVTETGETAAGGIEARRFGTLVGRMTAHNAQMIDCSNSGDVTVTVEISQDMPGTLYVGGLVGLVGDPGDDVVTRLDRCSNTGNVTVNTSSTDPSQAWLSTHYVGGVAGATGVNKGDAEHVSGYTLYYGEIRNCVNEGAVSATWGGGTGGYFKVGGILGYSEAAIFDCVNKGAVSFINSDTRTNAGPSVGGITAVLAGTAPINAKDCVNEGSVSMSGMFSNASNGYASGEAGVEWATAGGCFGTVGDNATLVENCDNKGQVTVDAQMINTAKSSSSFGGVIGVSMADVKGCDNLASKTTSLSGMSVNCHMGGVLGYSHAAVSDCVLSAPMKTNYDVSSLTTNQKSAINNIGGIVGYAKDGGSAIKDCETTSSASIESECNGQIRFGGIVGMVYVDVLGCDNNAKMQVNRGALEGGFVSYIGGIIGWQNAGKDVKECSNSGNLSVTMDKYSKKSYVAGIVANTKGTAIISCSNSGSIDFDGGAMTAQMYISGICGMNDNATASSYEDLSNSGNISVSNWKNSSYNYIGGITGQYSKAGNTYKNLSNSGDIVSEAASKMRLGGIGAAINSKGKVVENVTNTGSISMTNGLKDSQIGGIAGYWGAGDLKQAASSGTVTGAKSAAGSFAGGIIGALNVDSSWTDVESSGAVVMDSDSYAGHLLGEFSDASKKLTVAKPYSFTATVNGAEPTDENAVGFWNSGTIEKVVPFTEDLAGGKFTYDGKEYPIVQMKDGRWWMAKNLAYLPEGMTPSTDNTEVTAGVFAPLKVKADKTGAEFATDEATIDANGYLYQAEVALGLKVGDITTVEQAQALEKAQGICPPGWHVPAISEILALVGKSAGETTNTSAPYYDGANGSIALLNADGFNMEAYGFVSIVDVTKTSGSLSGWFSGYPDKLASSMFCGSSYAGVTYKTSGDAASGIKNLQFHGFMPMTNKATEAEYTCNGTKVSYRIAGPLRCVRNAE